MRSKFVEIPTCSRETGLYLSWRNQASVATQGVTQRRRFKEVDLKKG